MKEHQSLSHTRWDCKYHVVFIPKRRKKRIFGVLRRQLGEIFHELADHDAPCKPPQYRPNRSWQILHLDRCPPHRVCII